MTVSSTTKQNNTSEQIQAFIRSLDNPLLDMDYHPGLERVKAVLSHYSLRRPKLRIRIAGTNGKGSTGYFLESAFRAAGFTTGFYTSPHILRFNERIRINGIPANDALLTPLLTDMLDIGKKCGASPFELATALAINTFNQADVDIEILECGLGARLDATTAVPADMALITPIALDHQAWLGDSLQKIAYEKSYVMQGCEFSISVPQDQEISDVLVAFNPELLTCEIRPWEKLSAPGQHQQINASLAYAAIMALTQAQRIDCDLDKAQAAIAACQVPGRLQQLSINDASIWLDAAHNRHAIEALLPSLTSLADPFDAILVFTREDRTLADAIHLLQPYSRQIIYKTGGAAAGEPIEQLRQQLAINPHGSFLVLGSFITVANILRNSGQLGSE